MELQEEVKALKTAVSSLTENNQLLWSRILSLEKTVKSQEQIIMELQNRRQESSSVENAVVTSDQTIPNEAQKEDAVEVASPTLETNNRLTIEPPKQGQNFQFFNFEFS